MRAQELVPKSTRGVPVSTTEAPGTLFLIIQVVLWLLCALASVHWLVHSLACVLLQSQFNTHGVNLVVTVFPRHAMRGTLTAPWFLGLMQHYHLSDDDMR
jgi:hypothetical protein